MGKLLIAAVAACVIGCATAKDRVVVVPAHPDDLIPCFGTCLLSKDIFEWHVIEFTHGEREQRQMACIQCCCPTGARKALCRLSSRFRGIARRFFRNFRRRRPVHDCVSRVPGPEFELT